MSPEDLHLHLDGPSLSNQEFDELSRLIYETTGISLNDSKKVLVESRLARRLRALGSRSFHDYCTFARNDTTGTELRELTNAITTNKTDFFRESHHFDFLRSTILPAIQARASHGGPRKVRVWSAACSSGEEPYTIAISLLEHFGLNSGWDIRVLATDIDTQVLEKAEKGVYSEERLDGVPADLRAKYFLRGTGMWSGHYRARPELQSLVKFKQLNFIDRDWGIRARFDVVFCRNVVIYFDRATQDMLFRRFHPLIADDGYLIIGHSESLHFLPQLYAPLKNTVYKRKSAGGAEVALPQATAAPITAPIAALPARRPTPAALPPVQKADSSADEDLKPHSISIGDVYSSDKPASVRTLLGSCVAACLWDPLARIGGMNHILLPEGPQDGTGASRYGVHAMELLINALMRLGAERRRLRAKVFGAAHVLGALSRTASVPEKNAEFIKGFLERESIPIVGQRLGGTLPLEVVFHTHTGKAFVRPVQPSGAHNLSREEEQYSLEIVRKVGAEPDDNITLF
ncbi:MAG: hypothetical protein IT454_06770 [Planctomycetes bacterium]|nr:hypothetical protein [Planctomycetota bacterium]